MTIFLCGGDFQVCLSLVNSEKLRCKLANNNDNKRNGGALFRLIVLGTGRLSWLH